MPTTLSTTLSTDPPAYQTKDLHVAAWLSALGYPLTIEGHQHQRLFVFSDLPPGAVESYFTSPCPLSPASLFSAYTTLRKRLFATAP
jgi:hypothetical protein